MFKYNIDDYSAYMISHNQISLTYRGEITQQICDFKFLQYEIFEEILYLLKEETAISLPWAQTIIINFWKVEKENFNLFYIVQGMKKLFEMGIIKELQEVQFKFFSHEQLQALVKFKYLKSENSTYYYLEIQEDNDYQVNLQWRDSLENNNFEQQLIKRNLQTLFESLGNHSNIYDDQQLFETILEFQYDSIFIYIPSSIKLKIHTKIYEQSEEQLRSVEVFIHSQWFDAREDNLIAQFQILNNQLLKHINKSDEQFVLDYALLYNEQQANCSSLMSKQNSLIIKTLFSHQQKLNAIYFSLMPFEIHLEFDIQNEQFNLEINLNHEDNQDMYQEAMIILLQTITTCKLFKTLNVDISQDENSKNENFPLFNFLMIIQEFLQQPHLNGTFSYNNFQMLPRLGPICSKGVINYIITDRKAKYEIRHLDYVEIQREIISFISYVSVNSQNVYQMIISCHLPLLDCSSTQFYSQLVNVLSCLPKLLEFELIDIDEHSPSKYMKINQGLIIPTKQYFNKKLKIILTGLFLKKNFSQRMREQSIKEMIQFLPADYHCLLNIQY